MGLQRSAGVMANYVYRLSDVEHNHEVYTREYKIAASSEIQALVKRFLNTNYSSPVGRA
jgi:malonyl-CoA decarboxylase